MFEGGTIDSISLKSFYFIVSGHFECEPIIAYRTFMKYQRDISKVVDKYIKKEDNVWDRYITNLDIADSIKENGYTFYHIEYNIFNKTLNNQEVLAFLNKLSYKVYTQVPNPDFELVNKKTKHKK